MVDGYAAYVEQGDMIKGENYYYGGLIRYDMTPKPAYYVIKNLFEKEWHTEISLTTGTDGSVSFKGFYGDYEAVIDGKSYSLGIHKNDENKILIEI